MCYSPFFKAIQRVVVFQDQIVGDGKYLLVFLGKATFQILCYSDSLPYGVKKVCGSVEAMCCFCIRNGPAFCKELGIIETLRRLVLSAAAIRRDDLAGCFIQAAD